ncbi:metallophosphoesterase family protein [Acuticoccus kandeliae]|uniref:metallophosphoesterase family protein n=1 Tax=Acuticoccus kandeliae TaxID=2073160 RepID=UPI001472F64A|nr:DNA repair exonuclease [Acuticoccus kandeliae]
MPFRFIHTGDLHLDSPLTGLGAHEGADAQKAKRVAGAARAAFVDLVDEAIRREVDAFLIAGDLWDGDWRDLSAGLFVQGEIARLGRAGIMSFAILGNHDAQSQVTDRIRNLDGLHIFASDRATSVECGEAVIHGQSFATPAVHDNLAARYPEAVPGRINIGLLHTALDGSLGHGNYAPCTLADLSARQYDYWALGHVHTRQILQRNGRADGGWAAFCGVLQGRHARETGQKGAWYGVIDADGVRLEAVDLHHVGWFLAEADVTEADAEEAMRAAIEAAVAGAPAACDVVVLRVRVTGRTAQHFRLANSLRSLDGDARFIASAVDARRVMIEEVVLATTPPEDGGMARLPQHFEAMLARAAADPAVAAAAAEAVTEVLSLLPGPVRRQLLERNPDLLPFDATGDLSGLLAEAARRTAARIAGS